MIQLRGLSGNQAGAVWSARRFPVRVGRAASAEIQLHDSGVWDGHLRIEFLPSEGFVMFVEPPALVAVNGNQVNRAVLRNGDTIDCGSARLQFWLADSVQRGLRPREFAAWTGMVAVLLLQVGLVYWLLR